jgi:hypothetical protein
MMDEVQNPHWFWINFNFGFAKFEGMGKVQNDLYSAYRQRTKFSGIKSGEFVAILSVHIPIQAIVKL